MALWQDKNKQLWWTCDECHKDYSPNTSFDIKEREDEELWLCGYCVNENQKENPA